MRFRILLYNVWSYLALPLLAPLFFIKSLVKGRKIIQSASPASVLPGSRFFWVQAASAGEVLIARTLIDNFKMQLSDFRWLVITTTHSGYMMAEKTFAGQEEFLYLPWDFSFVLNRWLKRYPPAGFLVVENGIWPNLIARLANCKVILAMLNGRVNDRTWRRYRRNSFFLRAVLPEINFFCVQTRDDAQRLINLGAVPERISITGNAKYDQEFPEIAVAERNRLLGELGLNGETRLLIAGSTHPGEEEIILDAFDAISAVYPDVVLMIAPRHLERLGILEDLLRTRKIAYQARSLVNGNRTAQVLILDTFGELSRFYGLAYLAFVGGSFVPVGGHNLLEPAARGCPVLFGPFTQNFREITKLLIDNGVGFEVGDSRELADRCLALLNEPVQCQALGVKASSLVAAHRGATKRMIDLYMTLFNENENAAK